MTSTNPWPALRGIAYGGDYTPEQWPRETWDEDVALMREAGVNLVSVGIFSWALLETSEGVFDFAWLDELHRPAARQRHLGRPRHPDRVAARVVLRGPPRRARHHRATARSWVSARAAWRRTRRPRTARRSCASRRRSPSATRSIPRSCCGTSTTSTACPSARTTPSSRCAPGASGCGERYGTLDDLNRAWGTAFWGQHYGEWEHIGAPAAAPSVVNPAQRLDFARFTDHQLRECFIAERDAIRAHASQPITTNFMANQSWTTDLWAWAREVDIVSDDHYLWAADPEGEIGLAIAADLSRSVGGGKPWILMEHSTSAVNWQPRNVAKRPGEMARNSLSHLGRGADAILFFQWRASRSGAEKFHSAMLPHAGTSSRVWREVVDLGDTLGRLDEVRGSRVVADVAILWDFESFWAQDLEWRPSEDVAHAERVRAFYERCWRDGITVDFALPGHDLSAYRLVIAPAQYLLSDGGCREPHALRRAGRHARRLVLLRHRRRERRRARGRFRRAAARRARRGGRGVPAAARGRHMRRRLDGEGATYSSADVWQEHLIVDDAEVRGTYVDGPGAGMPAITRNRHGAGTAGTSARDWMPRGSRPS